MESSRPPLSHSEARRDFFQKTYERIAELGKIGVWECDLATEALTWTDTVYDMFDLPRQSSVNRATVLQCYEPASRRKMERLRAEAIARCSTFTVDVEIMTPLGNARWIRITGDVEQEAGRAVRIFGTKQDITLEKTAQQEVLALQTELIHLSRASAMDAMRSTLAHELNQPLAAIANYVSALRKLMDPRSADHGAAQEILDGVERSALKTGEIIRGVRDLTRGRRAQPVPFDLEAAVREAGTIALAGARPRSRGDLRLRRWPRGDGRPRPGSAGRDQPGAQRPRRPGRVRRRQDYGLDEAGRQHGRSVRARHRPGNRSPPYGNSVRIVRDRQARRDGPRPRHLPHDR